MNGFMDLQFLLLALLCRTRCNLDTFTCEFTAHTSLGMTLPWTAEPMRVLR